MLVLVANLGSTSFKYRLFDMEGATADERCHDAKSLARGAVDRIGDSGKSAARVEMSDWTEERIDDVSARSRRCSGRLFGTIDWMPSMACLKGRFGSCCNRFQSRSWRTDCPVCFQVNDDVLWKRWQK